MSAKDDVLARFEPVVPTVDTAVKIAAVREAFRTCASALCEELPDGRSKSLALTKLEESAMHATKAITHRAPG